MNTTKKTIAIYISLLSILHLGSPHIADAYIDPNTGGFFFTSVLPFVYGILAAIVIFWKKIAMTVKGMFTGKKEKEIAQCLYLEHLRNYCQILPLTALGEEGGTEQDLSLDDVYIELNTTTEIKTNQRKKKRKEFEEKFNKMFEYTQNVKKRKLQGMKQHYEESLRAEMRKWGIRKRR